MERYENIIKIEQIRKLVDENQYIKAQKILDTMDISRIKTLTDLSIVADVLTQNERFEDAMKVLTKVYSKTKTRRILYQLVELSIKRGNVGDAEDYLARYTKIAPQDSYRYVFRYCIDKLNQESNEVLIASLEQLKEHEYIEVWAYELAKLYHKAGMKDKCVRECSDIVLWFGDGIYVEKAKLLKAYYVGEINPIHMLKAKEKREAEIKLGLDKTKDYSTIRSQIDDYLAKDEASDEKTWEEDNSHVNNDSYESSEAVDYNFEEIKEYDHQKFKNYKKQIGYYESLNKVIQEFEQESSRDDEAINFDELAVNEENVVDHDIVIHKENFTDNFKLIADNNWESINDIESSNEYDENSENQSEIDKEFINNYDVSELVKRFANNNEIPELEKRFANNDESPELEQAVVNNDEVSELEQAVASSDELLELEKKFTNKDESPELEQAVANNDEVSELEKRFAYNDELPEMEQEFIDNNSLKYNNNELVEDTDTDRVFDTQKDYEELFLEYGINYQKTFGLMGHNFKCKQQLHHCFENIINHSDTFQYFMIIGENKSGKTTLAKNISKALYQMNYIKSSRVAIISANKLNGLNLNEKKDKLINSSLIIEEADFLQENTVKQLLNIINDLNNNIFVILEGSESGIKKIQIQNPSLKDYFTNYILLPRYSKEEYMEFIINYMEENEYKLTQEAEIKIMNYIEEIENTLHKDNQLDTIMNIAIKAKLAADERNKKALLGLFSSGELEENDFLFIKPEDVLQ